ncbi:MAG: methyltransferase domain-containing protein [Betaproteobacteria bacterium]|nr:methyltransferase domain-containing protein [Betaproteobacteria bacterium]
MAESRFIYTEQALIKAQQSLSWSREIAERLIEHFDFINLSPEIIMNLGCGPGWGNMGLQKRFPTAQLINVDLSWSMLTTLKGPQKNLWQRLTQKQLISYLCSDAQQLSVRSNSIDIVVCHLLLPVVDANLVLQEIKRILKPNGLLIFSSFGPDTLKEIPSIIKEKAFLQQLVDMHDVGDALINYGFQHPIMDRENISISFPDTDLLIHDFYTYLGYSIDRVKRLKRAPPWLRAMRELKQNSNDSVNVTLEINYGHAWKKDIPKTADGRPIIPIEAS